MDFGKGEGFPMATTTPNKEKKNKRQNKSCEASVGLANLNRWQVESSYCQRFVSLFFIIISVSQNG